MAIIILYKMIITIQNDMHKILLLNDDMKDNKKSFMNC